MCRLLLQFSLHILILFGAKKFLPQISIFRKTKIEMKLEVDSGISPTCILSYEAAGLYSKIWLSHSLTDLPTHSAFTFCFREASEIKNVPKSGKSPQFSWPPPPPPGCFGLFWIWEKFEIWWPPPLYLIWENFEILNILNFGNPPSEKKHKLKTLKIAQKSL